MSPERKRIAKIFQAHIEKAIDELGLGYVVTTQGRFNTTPIIIQVGSPGASSGALWCCFFLFFSYVLSDGVEV